MPAKFLFLRASAAGDVGFYADFVAAPLMILMLAAADQVSIGLSWGWAGIFGAGLSAWTFAEYAIHRWILHRAAWARPAHDIHHADPRALAGGISSLFTPIPFLAALMIVWCAAGVHAATAVTAGLYAGYFVFIVVHWTIHHRRIGPRHALYRTKLRHLTHHLHGDADFGVTTAFWDRALGTYGPPILEENHPMKWSLIVAAASLAIYWFAVRPQLRKVPSFAAFYQHLDDVEAGLWTRICWRLKGYKELLTGFGGLLATELPDILTQLQVVDFDALLPGEWAKRVGQGIILALIFLRTRTNTAIGHKE